jgi:hypothetical protein
MNTKPMMCLLFVLLCLFLTSCGSPLQSYHTSQGMIITPSLPQNDSELANILGISRWNFKIQTPQKNQMVMCKVEVREAGHKPIPIGGVGVGEMPNSDNMNFSIALYPVGSNLSSPCQLKVMETSNGNGSTSYTSNPFVHAELASGSPVQQPDGSFLLMSGNNSGKPVCWPDINNEMPGYENNISLVCTFHSSYLRSP